MATDEQRGVYRKYRVERLHDPTGKHAGCNYFVLDLDHDEFAIPALRAYAKSCREKFPQLAKDIDWILQFSRGQKAKMLRITPSAALAVKMERNTP